MKIFLTVALTIVCLITGIGAANAQRKIKEAVPKKTPVTVVSKKDDVQILAEESSSSIEEPFIFVARNEKQLAELKSLSGVSFNSPVNFETSAVVAAFAGNKPTAGYEIVFSKTATGVKINLSEPPKGAMLAQIITAPMKIALVPAGEDAALEITAGRFWTDKMQNYQIKTGEFEESGGFVARITKFALTGTISLLSSRNLVTAFFNLSDKSNLNVKKTTDAATGSINNTDITFEFVNPGTLIQNPRPSLRASGKLSGRNLSLKFESLPTNVADGFGGQGSLTAVKK